MTGTKNNRWLPVLTLLLLVANIITLVLLWTNNKNLPVDKRPGRPGAVFEYLTKELQLNDQQQSAYKQLRDQHQAAQKGIQDSIRNAKDALFSLLQQPNVPDSLLEEYSKRATAFDQQLDIITFKHFKQVRALCDATQQKKFDAIIKEVMRRMGGPGRHPPGQSTMPAPPGHE